MHNDTVIFEQFEGNENMEYVVCRIIKRCYIT